MPLGQRFDAQKAIEVILFIATRVGDPTFHRLSKLLYFADLKQLETYGQLVLADNYVAMRHGPVPSCTYDLLKAVRDGNPNAARKRAKEAFEVLNGKTVKALRAADEAFLSNADKTSLEFAIEKYGRLSFEKLTKASHDSAWKSADENDFIDIEEVAKTAGGPELLEFVRASNQPPQGQAPRGSRIGGFLKSLTRS